MEEAELLALAKCPIFSELYYFFHTWTGDPDPAWMRLLHAWSIIMLSAQQNIGKETGLIVLVCISVDVGRILHLR